MKLHNKNTTKTGRPVNLFDKIKKITIRLHSCNRKIQPTVSQARTQDLTI